MSDTTGSTNVANPPPPSDEFIAYPRRPPRPRPEFPEIRTITVGWIVLAGVVVDLALRTQVASLSSTLAALLLAGPILGARLRRNPLASSFLLAAVVFAIWLPLRASTWLTGLNAAVVAGFLLAAAAVAHPIALGLNTSTISTILSRIFLCRYFVLVLGLASAPLRSLKASRLLPIVRGLIIAVIPVAVLGGLLAAADTVFEQYITTDVDLTGFFEHGFLTVLAVAGIAGLIAVTGVQADETFKDHRPLGATEAIVLLFSIGGLYAAFAFVQLLSALGRTDQILAAVGVTASDYARDGFFQLLWVAGLTLVLLGLVRLLVATGSAAQDRIVRALGAGVALLTTLIVVVAVVRLGLYTDAFGQTTLRWYCTAFAWMLGAAFIAIAIGHIPKMEHRLPMALLGLFTITLFTVNLLNPEARVAEHNLGRADATESLDAEYLARLSADAWPTLLQETRLMSDRHSGGTAALDAACAAADEQAGYGLFGLNLSRSRLNC